MPQRSLLLVRTSLALATALAFTSGCGASQEPPGSAPFAEPDFASSSSAATVVDGLTADGLTLDPNGYRQAICIDSVCTFGALRSYALEPGTHVIHTYYSEDVDPAIGQRLGDLVVDADRRATLVSDHFDAIGASTLRLRTAAINVELANYHGAIGFDWSGGALIGADSTVYLPTGRRFGLADFVSGHLANGAYTINPSGDFQVNHDGSVTMGPDISASFTWNPDTRVLRARTLPVTVDFKGYNSGAIGFSDHIYGRGPVATLWVLRQRRYGFVDFTSSDPATAGGGFGGQTRVEDDQLIFDEPLLRYFRVNPVERRVEAIVAMVTADSNGPVGYFDIGGHLGGWGEWPPLTGALLVGRRYGISFGDGGAWFDLSLGGSCSQTTFAQPDGGTLTLQCQPSSIRPASPVDVTATVVSSSRIDILWALPSVNQTAVRVERLDAPGGAWAVVPGCNTGSLFTACSDTSGLQPGATYQYRVVASNSGGDSFSGPVAVSLTPPGAVSQLSATIVAADTIDLEWRQTDPAVTATVVLRQIDEAEFETIAVLSGIAQAYRDSRRAPARYRYQIVTEKGSLPPSSSDVVSASLLPPGPPTAVTAVPVGLNRIDVSWTVADADAQGFRILRSTDGITFTSLLEVGASARLYSDSAAQPDVTYVYSVVALSGFDQSPAVTSGPVTIAPTGTPQNFQGRVTAVGQISLSWQDAANETGYQLQVSVDGGVWTAIALPADTTSYLHSGLSPTSRYDYRLLALGPLSSTAAAVLPHALKPGAPAAPGGVRAVAVGAGTLQVTWTDVDNETDYQVRRAQGSSSATVTLPADSTATTLTGLNTSNYTLDVIARNGAGTAKTTITARVAVPAAPSGLTAVPQPGLAIKLTWTDNASNESGYEIDRATAANGPWVRVVVMDGTLWVDGGLRASTRYWYRVRAHNGVGTSAYATANTTTLNPCQGLPAGASCNDGNACTLDDVCGAGGLCAGTPRSCDDGNPCTADSCAAGNGTCSSTPIPPGVACDDGDVCTATSQCNGAGTCVGSAPVACPEDGNPCTNEVCVAFQGCQTTLKDACDWGTCVPSGGTPPLDCPPVAPIRVDASRWLGTTLEVRVQDGGFLERLDPQTVKTLTLRTGGWRYRVENPDTGVMGEFRLDAAGKLQMDDTLYFKGNGTDQLTIVDPSLPAAVAIWEMEDRFGLNDQYRFWPPVPLHDPTRPTGGIEPAQWNVFLDGCASPSGDGGRNVLFRWVITAAGGQGTDPQVLVSQQCRTQTAFTKLGKYALTLMVTNEAGRSSLTTQEINLRDYLVVSFGDSYASGEGNPVSNFRMGVGLGSGDYRFWDDSGAHFSRWSGHVQAALALERSDPHSSVTFLSFAVSGGAIPDVISQWKDDWDRQPRPPQIELARASLCNGDPNYLHGFREGTDCSQARPIDFILLSIGGNDAHFGDAIRTCAAPFGLHLPLLIDIQENCTSQHTTLADGTPSVLRFGDPGWVGNEFTQGAESAIAKLNDGMLDQQGNFQNLSSYPALNTALRNRLPFTSQTRVLIAEYPDVLTTRDGALCSSIVLTDARSFIDGKINANEILWAKTNVTGPLNSQVAATAQWGWEPLTDIDEEFVGRAACDYDGFSVTFQESMQTQDGEDGSMHPNRAGQEVLGRHFAYAMGVRAPWYVRPPMFSTTTDGQAPAFCGWPDVVVGTSCRGDDCDEIDIMCKPPRPGVELSPSTSTTRWISDGDNGTFQTPVCHGTDPVHCEVDEGVSCGNGVIVGLECRGSWCDDVRFQCRDVVAGRLKNCAWTDYFSEETRWNVFSAGKVANGARCAGSYCDLMSYYVCDLVGP